MAIAVAVAVRAPHGAPHAEHGPVTEMEVRTRAVKRCDGLREVAAVTD